MNIYKVAILIDGSFFRIRYNKINCKNPRKADIESFVNDIMKRVNFLTSLNDPDSRDVLLRTFYYDCRAYGGKHKRPDGVEIDFSLTSTFRASAAFLDDLKGMNQMALRLGDLSFDGWKIDPFKPSGSAIPDFHQKSVDMKIGMDIAWMANKHTIDKIVLVAGDSDFVSPMKFARKEGILIYLEPMNQKQIKLNLKEHSDFIL